MIKIHLFHYVGPKMQKRSIDGIYNKPHAAINASHAKPRKDIDNKRWHKKLTFAAKKKQT